MSLTDELLDRIRAEIEQCAPCFENRDTEYNQAGLTLAQISRDLLADRDELDAESNRVIDATRQSAIAGFAAVRAKLLAALGREDDRRTQLVQYVADLTADRDRWERQAMEAEAELTAAREQLDAVRQLAHQWRTATTDLQLVAAGSALLGKLGAVPAAPIPAPADERPPLPKRDRGAALAAADGPVA